MTRRQRQLLVLCASTLTIVLASSASAGALSVEEATTLPLPTETTPSQPEAPAGSTQTAPPATTPGTTTTAPPATTETAPVPPTTESTTPQPQVSGQSSQGTTGAGGRHGDTSGERKAGGKHEAAGSNGGAKAQPHRGKAAPKPSALTPPLPLSLSSSIAGVPAFFIESFRIPPFLLPIYQAAGTAYGVPWQVLAAINEVETDYGRDLSVSSAGAEGWMQFLPSSWATYGVDANGDGYKDPYNPADAIFAAARYLRAAGAATNLRGAIFSYNHSQAYVESVLLRAKLLGGTPSGLLGAITGLTESRFPVHAKSHFSDGFPTVASKSIPATTIYSEPNAPVIAVQDGEVVQIGDSPELGRFISLRDAYGNTYTYAKLGSIAQLYPVLQPHEPATAHKSHTDASARQPSEPKPTGPASAGTQPHAGASSEEEAAVPALSLGAGSALTPSAPVSPAQTPSASSPPTEASGAGAPAASSPSAAGQPSAEAPGATGAPRVFRAGPNDVYLHELHTGVQVIAGTVLGHVAPSAEGGGEPSMIFQIRPAGADAPLIDPKPILDGWVQLENTSVFRAQGASPFSSGAPSAGQVLLESKEQLERQVLANQEIDIYPCGRQDIETGQIDRRVLATLEFLAVSGLKPTVSALKCGHSELTTEGNVSEHSTGDAVDISAVNGIPIEGHQGPGSITDVTIRKLLTLQGAMKPHQIISLMSYPGADNTLAKADHYNHIHVGFSPVAASATAGGSLSSQITPSEWLQLIARLGEIPDPAVTSGRSAAAIPDQPGASGSGG
jgi:hypothetical protein